MFCENFGFAVNKAVSFIAVFKILFGHYTIFLLSNFSASWIEIV